MKFSHLNLFLNDRLSSDDFHGFIDDEVLNYSELIKKRGTRIPLLLDEDAELFIDQKAIKKLIKDTLAGHITNIHLAYISDCLTLAEKVNFESGIVQDIIFELADPEINGGYKTTLQLTEILKLFG
jgi:hypothetical protein